MRESTKKKKKRKKNLQPSRERFFFLSLSLSLSLSFRSPSALPCARLSPFYRHEAIQHDKMSVPMCVWRSTKHGNTIPQAASTIGRRRREDEDDDNDDVVVIVEKPSSPALLSPTPPRGLALQISRTTPSTTSMSTCTSESRSGHEEADLRRSDDDDGVEGGCPSSSRPCFPRPPPCPCPPPLPRLPCSSSSSSLSSS